MLFFIFINTNCLFLFTEHIIEETMIKDITNDLENILMDLKKQNH